MPTRIDFQVKFRGRTYSSPRRGLEAFRVHLNKSFEKAVQEIDNELKHYVQDVVDALIARHSGAWPSGTTDNSLSRRSGKSMDELASGAKVSGSELDDLRGILRISAPLVYHEYGATIRGSKGLLTIPLPAALNNDGTPKRASSRMWKNTFVQRSKAGNLIIFQRRGRNIVPLYVLKEQVTFPPRLGAREEMANAIPRFRERVADAVASRLSK